MAETDQAKGLPQDPLSAFSSSDTPWAVPLPPSQTTTCVFCIFGAPRYADRNAYNNATDPLPTQVRRRGDEVPTVPPAVLGYADHPLALTPEGSIFVGPSLAGKVVAWPSFVAHFFRQHSIETYRHELGRIAGANAWRKPLTDFKKL